MTRVAYIRTLRMAATSTVASLVDVLTLMSLARLHGMPPGAAAASGCLAGGVTNFFLMRQFVFPGIGAPWLKPLFVYVVSVVLCGALLSGAIVQVAVRLGLAILLAKLVAQAATLLAWNFPVTARVVFRSRRRS